MLPGVMVRLELRMDIRLFLSPFHEPYARLRQTYEPLLKAWSQPLE